MFRSCSLPAAHCNKYLERHCRMASFFRHSYSTVQPAVSNVVNRKMNLNSADLPKVFLPPVNRSMQVLDRSFFRKAVHLAAASISDVKQITTLRKELERSGDILKISPIKHLREDDSSPGAKCILLRHEIQADGIVGPSIAERALTKLQIRKHGHQQSLNWWKIISLAYGRTT